MIRTRHVPVMRASTVAVSYVVCGSQAMVGIDGCDLVCREGRLEEKRREWSGKS
jgi:hypothetical protein